MCIQNDTRETLVPSRRVGPLRPTVGFLEKSQPLPNPVHVYFLTVFWKDGKNWTEKNDNKPKSKVNQDISKLTKSLRTFNQDR